MSGSGSNNEDAPACETEETDSDAQELHESQSPALPEPTVPYYQGLLYELLLGGFLTARRWRG